MYGRIPVAIHLHCAVSFIVGLCILFLTSNVEIFLLGRLDTTCDIMTKPNTESVITAEMHTYIIKLTCLKHPTLVTV